jgi:hypothetical protein
VTLPVRFTPRPPQAETAKPSHTPHPVPQPRAAWEIGTTPPKPAPSPDLVAAPEQDGGSPQPQPAAPSWPEAGPGTAAAAEPARPQGAWRRFLRWWRGY